MIVVYSYSYDTLVYIWIFKVAADGMATDGTAPI